MLFILREYYSGKEYIIACLLYLIAMIVSFSLHEFAHAFVAYKNGDDTPKYQGRLTLNPMAHIDPIGFVFTALFFVGWAKPVQINPNKFKHYRKGMTLVSIAGVIMNLIIAFISCGIYVLLIKYGMFSNKIFTYLTMFFNILFTLNVSLAVFNFLPIYPLDGFNFISSLTSGNNGFVNFMYKYGSVILLALMIFFSDWLSIFIGLVSMPIFSFWGLFI